MGWASPYIVRLTQGETVAFRPHGHSMTPIVRSGQRVTVAPLSPETVLAVADVVLCKVKGREYLHRIAAVKGKQFQIANARGFINGWIARTAIFGRMTSAED